MGTTVQTKSLADLTSSTKKKQAAKPPNYKSKFEKTIGDYLGKRAEYEPDRIHFTQPAKQRYYLPDFKIGDAAYIECKGKWTADDRAKHVWIKEQNPNVRIILLFQNSKVRLSKRSKTTYGEWATKNGLEWLCWKETTPETLIKIITNENSPNNRNTRGSSRSKGGTKSTASTVST